MRWPSFLTRNRGRSPRPLPEIPAGYDMDAALTRREAERQRIRAAAARKGASTKQHNAYARDPLLNAQVEL